MKFKLDTRTMVQLGLLTAVVAVFSFTPIGSIPVGPLVITLNVIPVAIAAVTLGPAGGAIIGGVFGIFSFMQCFGIGMPSAMGIALLEETGSPLFCFVQRFFPRLIDGFIIGLLFRWLSKNINIYVAFSVSGFCAALFNTILFMSALVIVFSSTEYMTTNMAGKGFIAYVIGSIGLNAVFEMIVTTIATGAVCTALYKAKLVKFETAKAQ